MFSLKTLVTVWHLAAFQVKFGNRRIDVCIPDIQIINSRKPELTTLSIFCKKNYKIFFCCHCKLNPFTLVIDNCSVAVSMFLSLQMGNYVCFVLFIFRAIELFLWKRPENLAIVN